MLKPNSRRILSPVSASGLSGLKNRIANGASLFDLATRKLRNSPVAYFYLPSGTEHLRTSISLTGLAPHTHAFLTNLFFMVRYMHPCKPLKILSGKRQHGNTFVHPRVCSYICKTWCLGIFLVSMPSRAPT